MQPEPACGAVRTSVAASLPSPVRRSGPGTDDCWSDRANTFPRLPPSWGLCTHAPRHAGGVRSLFFHVSEQVARAPPPQREPLERMHAPSAELRVARERVARISAQRLNPRATLGA